MKLKDWAESQGISYQVAWKWFRDKKLPVPAIQTPSGMILVQLEKPVAPSQVRTYVYARVSGYGKKADLDRQAERCVDFCRANGWAVEQVIKEVASGMNDKRPKLTKLLEAKPGRLVVEHKDRLTRFGFNYLELLLPKLGCELVVVNRDAEEQADLMKDLVAVVTSFCCRLYGLRRGINKVKALKEICSAP